MEDLTDPDAKRCKQNASTPTSSDVQRVELPLTMHDSQSSTADCSEASSLMLPCAADVADTAGGCCGSGAAGNCSLESGEKNSTSNEPVIAATDASSTSALEHTRELSSSEEAQRLLSSQPVKQSPEEQCRGTDVATSSQDSASTSTGQLDKPSSSDEIEESLQCVICQEMIYKCVRSVSHCSLVTDIKSVSHCSL